MDFRYARYKPLTYFEGEVEEQQRQSQRNLAKFMKILMVKRLESSFHAFRLTLDRFARSYERMYAANHTLHNIIWMFAEVVCKNRIRLRFTAH